MSNIVELVDGLFLNLDNVLFLEVVTEDNPPGRGSEWVKSRVTYYMILSVCLPSVLIFEAGKDRDKPFVIQGDMAKLLMARLDEFRR